MQLFTTQVVNLMKSEGLYASQGGPIILSQVEENRKAVLIKLSKTWQESNVFNSKHHVMQIENEYQNIEAAFGEQGPLYVQWAASMAVALETGVPWVMCKQNDAPDPVVSEPYLVQTENCSPSVYNHRSSTMIPYVHGSNLSFHGLPTLNEE